MLRKLKKKIPRVVREAFKALPLRAKLGLAVPTAGLCLLVFLLMASLLNAFIRPAAAAPGYISGISNDSGDELAYYCTHLAPIYLQPGAKLPVLCQAPALLASTVAPALLRVRNDGDKYAWGNCTYWASLRRIQIGKPIPNTWSDAYLWATRAAYQGWTVNHTPATGAIMQTSRGVGHVAFVEAVYPNGDWRISEMNAIGFNEVDYRTMTAKAAANYMFIH